ncbi:ethanolamine utilization protein EutH [Fusobacterium sp.]|uniref:ethanolamine utilization protein EutH n=1 Tax=Fusobacterium sp. TaxID=68766 RepID=UPI00261051D8|nr:ethanolamine utilization protein EutH [Fusobacterium sp.]
MGINNIIMYLMVFFMIIGAVDRILGNKYGYGKKFEDGIMTIGTLSLAMIGIISLSPIIADFLRPIITPFYKMFGADPAMFAGTILANDMGGYSLGAELALSKEAGLFGGLFLSSTLGVTLSFSVPVALGTLKKEDEKYLSKGILSGMATVPIGCFFGGLIAEFNIKMLILNLIPIFIFTIFICFALLKFPQKVGKVFAIFGKFMSGIITIGLMLQIIEILTGIVVIKGMFPALEVIKTVFRIGIVLAGAFPLVLFITNVFKKPLIKIGSVFNVNEASMAGLIACLAHNIPMFILVKDMDNKGKMINIAFSVSGAFVLGSHLGFTAGIDKSMVFPIIMTKLIGGITAGLLANYLYNKEENKKSK